MGGPRRNMFSLLIWQLWKNWSKVDTGRVPRSVECDKPVHFFVSNELIVNTLSCTEISDILWTRVGWFWQQKTHHCNYYDTVTVYTLNVNKIKLSYYTLSENSNNKLEQKVVYQKYGCHRDNNCTMVWALHTACNHIFVIPYCTYLFIFHFS